MRLFRLSAFALALAVETAYGYLDASPFFMFSTSELLFPSSQLQTASALTSSISSALSQCPSDFYILVTQPGVTHSDYTSKSNTPGLARLLSKQTPSSHIRSSLSIPDVLGEIDLLRWQSLLVSTCQVHTVSTLDSSSGAIPTTFSPTPHSISIIFPPPSPSTRMDDLAQNDLYLTSLLDLLPSSNYTVLYITSTTSTTSAPSIEEEYTMDSSLLEQTLHLDLKRDLSTHTFAKRENITLPEGGLFERYQFFTPGIFMGLVVGFILLMILYVGISALASLQVSYAAFDKEQGQLAAKKSQ